MSEIRKNAAGSVGGQLTRESLAPDAVDVIIIGAGQAGLAMGYRLARSGVHFVILDASSAVGDVWRRRYDGLTLFTPRSMSSLPGLVLEGARDGYAAKDEFGDYLAAYATRFSLPVRLNHRVEAMDRNDRDEFIVRCSNGRNFKAPSVVVATGPFQVPKIPSISADVPNIEHHAAETFRSSAITAPSRILVVGDGASGRDIAAGLSHEHEVFLATGKLRKLLPERLFRRNIWWWLRIFGLLSVSRGSVIGRLMALSDPFPNRSNTLKKLANMGIDIRPRLAGFDTGLASLEDGSTLQVDVVIWATGYRDDYSWIRFEICGGKGAEPVPGLFFIGRPWQFGRRSSLIFGTAPDSDIVAGQVLKRHRHLAETGPLLGQQGKQYREIL